jgi:hypothetical protein
MFGHEDQSVVNPNTKNVCCILFNEDLDTFSWPVASLGAWLKGNFSPPLEPCIMDVLEQNYEVPKGSFLLLKQSGHY